MNSAEILFAIAICVVPVLMVLAVFVLPARIRMERRARELMRSHPEAERTSLYLAFRTTFSWEKQHEMDAMITEMARGGWTYLRATAANPLRTMRSWGGGLNLHFIRAQVAGNSSEQSFTEHFNAPTVTMNTKAIP